MKVFRSCVLKAAMIVAAMLLLGSTVAHAQQTTDQIVKFGPGAPPSLVDSNITEDPISGNIGIGTTSPSMSLDVMHPSLYGVPAIGGKVPALGLVDPPFDWAYLHVQTAPAGPALIWGHRDLPMRFGNENAIGSGFVELMRINPDGNVGIGTTTPAFNLDVSSGGDTQIAVRSTAPGGRAWTLQSSATSGLAGFFQIVDRTAGASRLSIDTEGNVGIGTTLPFFKLHVVGTIRADTSVATPGKVLAGGGFNGRCADGFGAVFFPVICNQDVAETFASQEATEPGDLVVLVNQSASMPTVRKSGRPYEELLAGVISTNPGLVFDNGETHLAGDNSKLITEDKTVVALAGRVPVKVSLENGAIRVGDPLTSSSKPGTAMKATQAGKVLGYALESADKDGTILLFVQPGYYISPKQLAQLSEMDELKAQVSKLEGLLKTVLAQRPEE